MMLGGAATGAVSMALDVACRAPHGGIFVLFAIQPAWGFVVAIVVGTLVATAAVLAAKQFWPNKTIERQAALADEAAAAKARVAG